MLLFDGDCAFCSASVRWVARLDKRARISFAPLQGELARQAGLGHHAATDGGTLVLMRESDGKLFTQSDALTELAHALGGGWRVLAAANGIPKCLRDGLYRWIARNRFRFFGRVESCPLADPEVLKRLRKQPPPR